MNKVKQVNNSKDIVFAFAYEVKTFNNSMVEYNLQPIKGIIQQNKFIPLIKIHLDLNQEKLYYALTLQEAIDEYNFLVKEHINNFKKYYDSNLLKIESRYLI